jgi:hypothetical protein
MNYEVSIVENKFIDEFRLAQANLVANIAAGKAQHLCLHRRRRHLPAADFPGGLERRAGQPGRRSVEVRKGGNHQPLDQHHAGPVDVRSTNPQTAASNLRTNATYRDNMGKAGLPANFWIVNPSVNNSTVVTNGPGTRYNGIQLVLNRRFSGGVQVQANYTYGKGYQQDFYSFRKAWMETEQNYNNGSASLGNVRHTFALNWVYELPFGQGKPLGSNAGSVLNGFIGDWSFMGVARFASGRLIDFGNVRLVGFSEKDLRNMLELRMTKDANNPFRTLVWYLPQEIIDNTVKAFNVTASGGYSEGTPTGKYFAPANSPSCLETVSGFGDCGARSVIVTGPMVIRWDMTLAKRIRIKGRVGLEFQVQVFNVFNRVNFNPDNYIGAVEDDYQLTGAVDSARTMQIALRVN